MKLSNKELQELSNDLKKLDNIYSSCENKKHLEIANNYYQLMQLKYWHKYIKNSDAVSIFSEDWKLIKNELRKIYKKHNTNKKIKNHEAAN